MAAFIKANLRAYLPGLESAESVKAIPREKDIAWNRPPNPDSSDYNERLADFELRLARTEQIHTCRPRRCLVYDRHGQLRCKRHAPFPTSEEDKVTEEGKWWQKRLYPFVNGWIPGILINVRCNNDGKILSNGEETKNATMYSTLYAAKKQGKNYNTSAIMADGACMPHSTASSSYPYRNLRSFARRQYVQHTVGLRRDGWYRTNKGASSDIFLRILGVFLVVPCRHRSTIAATFA